MSTPESIQPNPPQHLKNQVEETRSLAIETKHDEIRNILSRRQELLRELFVLVGMGEQDGSEKDDDNENRWTSFWDSVDLATLDDNKLKSFLDKHKLSSEYMTGGDDTTMEDSSSTSSPSSESHSPDPTKSMEKRLVKRILPPPARMVTRGVSGAVRPKSIDEILSRLDQKELGKSSIKEARSSQSSSTSTLGQSPKPKQSQRVRITQPRTEWKIGQPQTYNGVKLTKDMGQDRVQGMDLFAWQLKAKAQPLQKALQTANKTVSTQDWKLAHDEAKAIKVIQKIEDLKAQNMWGFRQLKRHRSSPRSKTHWDLVLDEMKWMHTDFKEERKWKKAMAYMVSRAVMEWHWAEDKSTVCVKSKIPLPSTLSNTTDQKTMMDTDENVQNTPESTENMDHVKVESMDVDMDTTAIVKNELASDESSQPQPSDHLSSLTTSMDDDDNDSEERFATPSLPATLIEEYRALIRDLDPNMPLITLPVEDFGEYDAHTLFPDLLLYTPPNPDYDDPYFDEIEYNAIVPFSALVSRKIKLVSDSSPNNNRNKRAIDGEPIISPYSYNKDKKIKTLPQLNRYDPTPLVSPLFAPRRHKDTPAIQPPIPPTSHTHAANTWSEEDDVCLIKLILQYSFNWDLICDTLNADRLAISGLRRTPWECHERWRQNNLTSLTGQVNSMYVSHMMKDYNRRPALVRLDSTSKRHRQYNIFEAIKRTQKKREEAQKPTNTTLPPRSTVETHGFGSAGQRLPTAMDLTMMKFQRDRQMTQALLEQRQLSANYGLPAHPLNAVPRPASQSVPHPQLLAAAQQQQQQQRLAAAAAAAAAQAQAQVQAQTHSSSPVNHASPIRPPMGLPPTNSMPQQQQQQHIPAAQNNVNATMNRYTPAQLQLLRQQQMALVAAAQAQAQQQLQQSQQAAASQGHGLPNGSAPVQRPVAPQMTTQPQVHTPAPSAETVAQQVSQMASPIVTQQPTTNAKAQQDEHHQQQSQQQQQQSQQPLTPQQQQQLNAQNQLQNNPLALMAQLMGLPFNQMGPQQQLQLQRYFTQLQLRNSAAATQQQLQNAAPGISMASNPNNIPPTGSVPATQQQQLSASLLAAQQQQQLQQRFQQMAQLQQAIQQQQALQQQQQQQQTPPAGQQPSQQTSPSPVHPPPQQQQ